MAAHHAENINSVQVLYQPNRVSEERLMGVCGTRAADSKVHRKDDQGEA